MGLYTSSYGLYISSSGLIYKLIWAYIQARMAYKPYIQTHMGLYTSSYGLYKLIWTDI